MAVRRLTDHLEIGLRIEKRPQPLADDRVVVGQQDPQLTHSDCLLSSCRTGTRTKTVVPPSGARLD